MKGVAVIQVKIQALTKHLIGAFNLGYRFIH